MLHMAIDTSTLPLGRQLALERIVADVKQYEVARRAGLSLSRLSRLENGVIAITPAEAERIRAAIDAGRRVAA